MTRSLIAALLCCVAAGTSIAARDLPSPVGKKVDGFALVDFRGKTVSLSDFKDHGVIVVAFLGTECPVAKLYVPRLNELSKTYADRGVAFVAIDSNQQDSIAELAAFARNHAVSFPLLKDPSNVVADQFGALRTPEVFVLDAERVIRYRGRIDDQYGVGQSSGYAKPKAQRHDLAWALDDILAGQPVRVPETPATGCFIGRISKVPPRGEVTYANTIAKILRDRCVECHRPGEVAPFTLTTYEEVVGWAPTMAEVVNEGRMPPWFANPEYGHFSNDARLSDEEKRLLHTWIDNGCPEGNPADLPVPVEYVDGWRISKPDLVVAMNETPYTVPAEGVVEYKYFTVDPGFTEDKWIQQAEARPGNRSVVHHIIVFFQPPRSTQDFQRRGGLAGYAPGNLPRIYPIGVAAYVPAGSKLIFQMHYTPNGTEQQDLSQLGLVFADPKTVKKKVHGGAAINPLFRIPPGANNHRVDSRHRFKQDFLLTSMTPHMHLRGKSFRFEAEYPDGKREILLDVPRYDFNWQLRYELVEPKLMPAGTVLHCTGHFDNSEENLANPNPKETVRWGDQTFEEMMIGFFGGEAVDEDAFVARDGE